MLLLLPDPFRGIGASQKSMEPKPQKPDNCPGPGPEVVERQRVSKESVAGQCRMKGVLGRVFAGAAGRILDSANPREIRA